MGFNSAFKGLNDVIAQFKAALQHNPPACWCPVSNLARAQNIPSPYKSGSYIRDNSRTATSTSALLRNWPPPTCCFSGGEVTTTSRVPDVLCVGQHSRTPRDSSLVWPTETALGRSLRQWKWLFVMHIYTATDFSNSIKVEQMHHGET